jgi:hypothetical protein
VCRYGKNSFDNLQSQPLKSDTQMSKSDTQIGIKNRTSSLKTSPTSSKNTIFLSSITTIMAHSILRTLNTIFFTLHQNHRVMIMILIINIDNSFFFGRFIASGHIIIPKVPKVIVLVRIFLNIIVLRLLLWQAGCGC